MGNVGAIRAGKAYIEVFTDNNKLSQGLRLAENQIRQFGNSVRMIGTWMLGIGAAVVAPLLKAAQFAGNLGHEISEMSKRTGVSVERLSALGYAARQSGIDMETLEKALKFMHKNLYAAADGSKELIEVFKKLGLTTADFQNMTIDERLLKIVDAFDKIKDPTERAALAIKLFGRSGTEILPFIAEGAARLRELMAEAQKLGLVLSAEDIEAAEKFHHELKKLWDVVKIGIFRIGQALMPLLEQMAEKMISVTVVLSEFIRQHQGYIVAAFKFGIGLLAVGAALIAFGQTMKIVAGILGIVRQSFNAVFLVLKLLWSPLTVIVALALGVAYALGYMGKVSDWLKEKFSGLKTDTLKAFDGIKNALAAGNIGLAAKIFWLTVRMEWEKATTPLLNIWETIYSRIVDIWTSGNFGDAIKYACEVAWEHFKKFGKQVWELIKGIASLGLQPLIKGAATQEVITKRAAAMMEKETGEKPPPGYGGKGIMSVTPSDSENEYFKRLKPYMERARKEVEEIATEENLNRMFPGGEKTFEYILNAAKNIKGNEVPLPPSLQKPEVETPADKAAREQVQKNNEELAKSVKAYSDAIKAAKEITESDMGWATPGGSKSSLDVSRTTEQTFGTFNKFALGQFGPNHTLERIAIAAEQTAKNTGNFRIPREMMFE